MFTIFGIFQPLEPRISSFYHTRTPQINHEKIWEQPGKIGGWGVLNREIVSFRSCLRTRGVVA